MRTERIFRVKLGKRLHPRQFHIRGKGHPPVLLLQTLHLPAEHCLIDIPNLGLFDVELFHDVLIFCEEVCDLPEPSETFGHSTSDVVHLVGTDIELLLLIKGYNRGPDPTLLHVSLQ